MRRSPVPPSGFPAPRPGGSRIRRGAGSAVACGLVLGAGVAAPAASAAGVGSTVLTVSPSAARTLRAPGLQVSPVGGASGSSRLVGLPVTTVGAGSRPTVAHAAKDGFRLRVGTRSAAIVGLRVRLASPAGVSARIAGTRVSAFTLSAVRARGSEGDARAFTATVRLSAAGVRTLRRELRAPRLRAGVLGTLRVTLVAPPAGSPATPGATAAATPDAAAAPAPGAAGSPTAPTTPVPRVTSPVVPTPDPEPVPDPGPEAAAPSLDWTIRSSWLSYLAAGNGTVTADGGAVRTATGSYLLPAAGGSVDGADAGTLLHDGAVRFRQPGHGIDMEFGAFQVQLDGTQRPQVTAVFTDRNTTVGGGPIEGQPGTGVPQRIVFGTLDLAEATVTREAGQYVVRRAPILLSAEAAAPFLFYNAGDAFGAMTLRAPLGS